MLVSLADLKERDDHLSTFKTHFFYPLDSTGPSELPLRLDSQRNAALKLERYSRKSFFYAYYPLSDGKPGPSASLTSAS